MRFRLYQKEDVIELILKRPNLNKTKLRTVAALKRYSEKRKKLHSLQ